MDGQLLSFLNIVDPTNFHPFSHMTRRSVSETGMTFHDEARECICKYCNDVGGVLADDGGDCSSIVARRPAFAVRSGTAPAVRYAHDSTPSKSSGS